MDNDTRSPIDERAYMLSPVDPDAEPTIDWNALIADLRAKAIAKGDCDAEGQYAD